MRDVAAVGLGVALLGLGCAGVPLHERAWVEVRTPNFAILSTLSEPATLALGRDLELFRSVVELATGKKIPKSPVPLQVFALDPGTYRSFALPGAAGYFSPSMRRSTIVICAGCARVEDRSILQHEYVHFLLRNRGLFAYPPWYDEGFAEFLSSVEVRRDAVDIGRPLRFRIDMLAQVGWIQVEDLLARRNFEGMSGRQVGAFYAEAWMLVHYLNFGRKGAKPRAELTRYLNALRQGRPTQEAVRVGFGMDGAMLGHRLRKYLRDGRYRFVTVPRDRLETGDPPELRAPTRAEVASALGGLSLELGRHAQAQRLFSAALAERPDDARALAGLAASLGGQGRRAEAEARYAAALAAGPDDALVQLDVARDLAERAEAETDPARRADLAQRARQHYGASWKLDDSVPETYAGYGATHLIPGQDPALGLETLEHAHRMLPGSPEIKLALARLYARLGRHGPARELALIVSTWSHSDEEAKEIRSLLEAQGEPVSGVSAR